MSQDVAIVIPCFNRAALVGAAIDSAIGQGAVIVVDDGSTDGSWAVIKSFGDRITAIRTANGGVSRARNLGVARTKAAFVRFLDSDDMLPPGSVAAQLRSADALDGKAIAFGDVGGSDGQPLESYGFPNAKPGVPLSRADLLGGVMPAWLPLFPREALIGAGGFAEKLDLGEDQELALRLHNAGWRFVRAPRIAYQLLDHAGPRLSRGAEAAKYEKLLALYRQILALAEPLDVDEKTALGRLLWARGRDASRDHHRLQAEELFALADGLAGRDAHIGHRLLRALYRLLPPYRAERLLQRLKRR
jgi:glycosyltransferase involved in cell wall biosynthesis